LSFSTNEQNKLELKARHRSLSSDDTFKAIFKIMTMLKDSIQKSIQKKKPEELN